MQSLHLAIILACSLVTTVAGLSTVPPPPAKVAAAALRYKQVLLTRRTEWCGTCLDRCPPAAAGSSRASPPQNPSVIETDVATVLKAFPSRDKAACVSYLCSLGVQDFLSRTVNAVEWGVIAGKYAKTFPGMSEGQILQALDVAWDSWAEEELECH
ncbi:MAG: hypothetical protein M1816_004884 [Peltula sp. TS41687]|nr:MAG: hypothetical protein M1816_004884 [Peltula sp. TS41687]